MNAAYGRFHPLSWPLWFKLMVGFLLAALIPLALLAAAVQPAVQDLGLQGLRSYVAENGEREQQAVAGALGQARQNLSIFAGNETYARRLNNVLLRDTPLIRNSPARIEPAQIQTLFDTVLLPRSTTLFESVRLLDRDGQLVAQASLETARAEVVQPDQSATAAYRAAINEQMISGGEDQIMSASLVNGQPVIEIIHTLRWLNGNPLGYLIAEVSIPRTILSNLVFDDTLYPAFSYVLAGQSIILSPETTLAQAQAAANAPGAARARSGAYGIDTHRTANGTEMLAYSAPIASSPLSLVIEVPTASAAAQTQSFFQSRLLPAGIIALVVALVLTGIAVWLLLPPLRRFRAFLATDTQEHPSLPEVQRGDEIGRVANALTASREHFAQTIATLEAGNAARARDIAATHDISRYAVSQRDLQTLLESVVNLIVERFPDIYHAQIFLLDADQREATLRASTGEAGRALLERGHRRAVGSTSVIGQVTALSQLVRIDDTATSAVHAPNPLLPDTRAELAVPLRMGDDLIGALDVQSLTPNAFSDELTAVLQTMADQIAIAIENARLYEESVQRLDEVGRYQRQTTQSAWQEYLRGRRLPEISSAAGFAPDSASPLRAAALQRGQMVVGERTERNTIPLAVPVTLRGATLGVVECEIPADRADETSLQLADELVNRLAITLDNTRLLEESQRATDRERIVNTIAARLATQTDVNEILQTAVREVGHALRVPQVTIQMRAAEPEIGGQS